MAKVQVKKMKKIVMLLLFIFVLIFSSISCYTGINPLLYSNNSCTIIFNANYEGWC